MNLGITTAEITLCTVVLVEHPCGESLLFPCTIFLTPHLTDWEYMYFPDENRSQRTETRDEQAHILSPVLQESTI
jgi:hypothetical protein